MSVTVDLVFSLALHGGRRYIVERTYETRDGGLEIVVR